MVLPGVEPGPLPYKGSALPLSYRTIWAMKVLHPLPHPYQGCALLIELIARKTRGQGELNPRHYFDRVACFHYTMTPK